MSLNPRVEPDPRTGPPPALRSLGVAAGLVVLAAVCVEADLRGPAATVLFFAAVLAGSLQTRPGYALLTAFTAWAVHTGFVTGHDGVLGLSDGRWQELLLFSAAAALTCAADRGRRAGDRRAGGRSERAPGPGDGPR